MKVVRGRRPRRERGRPQLDLNLVSLIDVFTILIFFLLANSTEVQVLQLQRAVQLPQARSEQSPRENIVVLVSATELLVQGRKVADTAQVAAEADDLIGPLHAELARLVAGAGTAADAPRPSVTIVGDRSIPYRLLRKVMVTATRAELADVSFAVRQKATT